MKILSINTAFSSAQIALELDGEYFEKSLDASAKSSEKVMPAIDEILREHNIKIKDINYIGVVVGTGSFTGVRIGVALVKGFMSCFQNLKVVAINSLDLMAYAYVNKAKFTEDFYCVQNALSGRFFISKYNKNGESLNEYVLSGELPEGLKIGLNQEKLSEVNKYIELTPLDLNNFTKKLINSNNFVDINQLQPVYMRLSQAEENLKNSGENYA